MDRILILFLTQHYQLRLQNFEQLDPERCTTDELIKVAAEASSLRKFIIDAYEEGYTQSTNQIVSQTDALERLQRILSMVSQRLGPPSEQERFYLCPEPVLIDTVEKKSFEGGKTFELLAYLDRIDNQSESVMEIGYCFENANRKERWQNKTQIVMAEMVEFLIWIVQRLKQQPEVVPIPLLRDTLVVQLGLKLLRCYGIPVREPKPILLSRKFLATFQGGEKIYDALNSDIFYGALYEQKACDLMALRHQFIVRARSHPEIPSSFIQANRDYLATLALDGFPFVIETGMHGTFPLWLLTLTDNIGDMVLYTTVPWMYSIYRDVVFRKNYNYLRDIETIVAHDHLFQFDTMSNGKVFVKETPQMNIRSLALYELYVFKELLKQKIYELNWMR